MTDPHSNQATPKYLGYVYQVLIAIEQCFQAKSNETIWIECFGDVYDGMTCTEVKHHFEVTNLTSNSKDFWKTLKNFVTEDTSSFNALILHTTANIPKDSIFYGWNELSKTVKYKRLKDHSPSDGVKDYYKASIIDCQRKDLLPILEKLNIKFSQLNIKDKWEELKNSQFLVLIPEQYKGDAFHWIYGYINKRAIDDRNQWNIKINDFNNACRLALSKFTQDKIPFDFIEKEDIDSNAKNFHFVEKMEEIKLKKSPIEKAVSDYLRAEQSQIKLLKYNPAMPKTLDQYDNSILDKMNSLKDEYSENIEMNHIETEVASKNSRDMYHHSMRLQLINIPEVNNTPQYYQNGRIHHNVNEGKFIWKFCEDDLL